MKERPMPTRVIALLAAIVIGGALAPAHAANADKAGHVYTDITPAELQTVLGGLGFTTAPYTQRTDDTPELMGTVNGINYSILFYRCDKSESRHCNVYQYWAKFTGLTVTPDQVNQWNRDTWLGVAYLGSDGAVRLVITQRVEGGTTKANIASVMADWQGVLKKFTGYIGFNKGS
jgi:hypothetical protein